MKIIGIRIIDGQPAVLKNLQINSWYPLGDFEEPSELKKWKIIGLEQRDEEVLNRLYKSTTEEAFADKMRISVQAIIGQNGSGKSSLAEIFLRLLNNFAYFLLDEKYRKIDLLKQDGEMQIPRVSAGRHLEMLGGFSAILYYEIDDRLLSIRFEDMQQGPGRMIFRDYKNGKGEEPIDASMSDYRRGVIMRSFFYTIYSNYSIYSFAHDEKKVTDTKNGKTWYSGLLHKNDGYVTPAVITPHRTENGLIDAEHEDELAKERLSVLSILYASRNKPFIDSIRPCEIDYRFKHKAYGDYFAKFQQLFVSILIDCPYSSQQIFRLFFYAWKKYLSESAQISVKYQKDKQLIKTAIYYLCYKSMKICVSYPDFSTTLGLKSIGGISVLNTNEMQIYKVVETLMSPEQASHITLKIRRCVTFLKNGQYEAEKGQMPIDLLIENNATHILTNEGKDKRIPFRTYDEVFLLTLPSFYDWEVRYRASEKSVAMKGNDDLFTLDALSSGQKQLFYSLSYYIYHINNIQSIERDDYRIIYHHINILMDEAELYYHPEYQRKLIAMIIDILGWCHVNGTKIRSINIIVLSHSPYVLSDVPNCNILYLKEGGVDHSPQSRKTETFASNIHTLLYNHFMLSNSIGEVARRAIEKITTAANQRQRLLHDDYVYYRKVVGMISEPMLRVPLEDILEQCKPEQEDRLEALRKQKEWIEAEIQRIEKEQK